MRTAALNRNVCPTMRTRSRSSAQRSSSRHSATVPASGFSIRTSFPASIAASPSSRWDDAGVAITTACTRSSLHSSAASATSFVPG